MTDGFTTMQNLKVQQAATRILGAGWGEKMISDEEAERLFKAHERRKYPQREDYAPDRTNIWPILRSLIARMFG